MERLNHGTGSEIHEHLPRHDGPVNCSGPAPSNYGNRPHLEQISMIEDILKKELCDVGMLRYLMWRKYAKDHDYRDAYAGKKD